MSIFIDGSLIATTDDTGMICIFNQEKTLIKSIKGIHEESVPTLTFSKDSKIMLTGCTLGNIRLFFTDFDGNFEYCLIYLILIEFNITADQIEPDLLIDNGHDMGILDADFCKTTRFDRK